MWILALTIASATLCPAGDPATADRSHSFLIVEGWVESLGSVPGEGGLDVVTATLRSGAGSMTVGLAPDAVFSQTGFAIREGHDLVVRLFQGVGVDPLPAQMVQNRTLNREIRLRTIRGEPLWDGDGRWHGGFCTHGQGQDHASRH